MENEIPRRLKSFGYGLLSSVILGIASFFVSPGFESLVNENFGGTVIGTLILLIGAEVAKHLRNIKVSKTLGASSSDQILL